jgi:hypothetical protein
MLQTLISYMDNPGFDAATNTLSFIVQKPTPKNLSKMRADMEDACATFRRSTFRGFFHTYANNIFGRYHGNAPLRKRVELLVTAAPLVVALIVPLEFGGTLSSDNMALMLDEDYTRFQNNMKYLLATRRMPFQSGDKVTIAIPKPALLSYADGSEGLPIMNDTHRLYFLSLPLDKYDGHNLRDMGFSSIAKLIARQKAADELLARSEGEKPQDPKPVRLKKKQHNKRARPEARAF